jgi:hypothetical protein
MGSDSNFCPAWRLPGILESNPRENFVRRRIVPVDLSQNGCLLFPIVPEALYSIAEDVSV